MERIWVFQLMYMVGEGREWERKRGFEGRGGEEVEEGDIIWGILLRDK